MNYSLMGNKIREIRKKRGITQKQLGESIGRTESSIAKYEQGLTEIPYNVLEKIASRLNIGVSDLLGKNEIIHESSRSVNEAFYVCVKYRDLLDGVLSSGKLSPEYAEQIRKQYPTQKELDFASDTMSSMGSSYTLKKLVTPRVQFLTEQELKGINALIKVLTEDRIKNAGK